MYCCDGLHCITCDVHLYPPITGANWQFTFKKTYGPYCNAHKDEWKKLEYSFKEYIYENSKDI